MQFFFLFFFSSFHIKYYRMFDAKRRCRGTFSWLHQQPFRKFCSEHCVSFFPSFLEHLIILASLELRTLYLTFLNRIETFPLGRQGLESVPLEIRDQGVPAVLKYVVDSSQASQLLFRSKVMIVGFESVGKTTILDSIFPISGTFCTQKDITGWKKAKRFHLQGKTLKVQSGSKTQSIPLEEKWKIRQKDETIILTLADSKEKGITMHITENQGKKPVVLTTSSLHNELRNPRNRAF